jgi:hypothetical protein
MSAIPDDGSVFHAYLPPHSLRSSVGQVDPSFDPVEPQWIDGSRSDLRGDLDPGLRYVGWNRRRPIRGIGSLSLCSIATRWFGSHPMSPSGQGVRGADRPQEARGPSRPVDEVSDVFARSPPRSHDRPDRRRADADRALVAAQAGDLQVGRRLRADRTEAPEQAKRATRRLTPNAIGRLADLAAQLPRRITGTLPRDGRCGGRRARRPRGWQPTHLPA